MLVDPVHHHSVQFMLASINSAKGVKVVRTRPTSFGGERISKGIPVAMSFGNYTLLNILDGGVRLNLKRL